MSNLSVVGLQWGDEGKGKVVDFLAGEYDAVARFNGGSNAGHTVVLGKERFTFHLIPSGALKEKRLLIGAGVVVDPVILANELSLLPGSVKSRLTVDGRCTVVSPFERDMDGLLEEMRGSGAIGTTKRGIGPAYAMRAFRLAPRVYDLLDGFSFKEAQRFYSKLGVRQSGLEKWVSESKGLLGEVFGDVPSRIEEIESKGGSVLFEASQGTLLDLLHGSYPFVTSSHTLTSYIPASVGIPPSSAGEAIGVMKCYTTRVGGGPFPTELRDSIGDGIRRLGNEYGSTTGRPRRVGWLDLVMLSYAVKLNGLKKVAITKLDVLSGVKEFRVCTAYKMDGEETSNPAKAIRHLDRAAPVYEEPFTMYGARFGRTFPMQAKKLVDYVERALHVEVVLVSYGEERSQTLEL